MRELERQEKNAALHQRTSRTTKVFDFIHLGAARTPRAPDRPGRGCLGFTVLVDLSGHVLESD